MKEERKVQAVRTVNNILHVLHERQYGDLLSCLDGMGWDDTEEIRECLQGPLEASGMDAFDEYGVPCGFHPRYEYRHEAVFFEYNGGSGFAADYETACGGELAYLCLQLKFLYGNGGLKRIFHTTELQ